MGLLWPLALIWAFVRPQDSSDSVSDPELRRQVARLEAELQKAMARRDLAKAEYMAGKPVMTFVRTELPHIVATLPGNALRHIAVGDPAEIALDRHPGQILKAWVSKVVDLSAEGQLAPSGDIPDWTHPAPRSRFPVGFELEEESLRFNLPGGAGGAAAIYTERAKPLRIIRKIVIRMYSWLNYFF